MDKVMATVEIKTDPHFRRGEKMVLTANHDTHQHRELSIEWLRSQCPQEIDVAERIKAAGGQLMIDISNVAFDPESSACDIYQLLAEAMAFKDHHPIAPMVDRRLN